MPELPAHPPAGFATRIGSPLPPTGRRTPLRRPRPSSHGPHLGTPPAGPPNQPHETRKTDPGAEPSTAEPELEIAVRDVAGDDFTEARILVDRIFEEYLDSGGHAELDELPEGREHLPWYLRRTETRQ